MFDFLKKKDLSLYSPVTGKMINIENVPDHVFASRMMGDGVAFEFQGRTVYAPCDGKITMIAHTKHAIGFITDYGVEILIHVGLDTVSFKGQGFKVLVHEGDKIKKGSAIMEIDRDFFKDKDVNFITPMVITQNCQFELKINAVNDVIKGESQVIQFI